MSAGRAGMAWNTRSGMREAFLQTITVWLLGACAFAVMSPVVAAPPAITLRLVTNGFTNPVEIANAGDGSGRLFVVEQGGVIKIVKDGALLATTFLDISAQVLAGGAGVPLGLAFHPRYLTDG